jgi:hypothetical protein
MSSTQKAHRTRFQNKQPKAVLIASYQSVVGGLAPEMVGSLPHAESRECSPPFRLVIVGKRGAVVFECEVARDGRVRDRGPLRKVRRSHFPAVALLTDESFFTRTFLIEREVKKGARR